MNVIKYCLLHRFQRCVLCQGSTVLVLDQHLLDRPAVRFSHDVVHALPEGPVPLPLDDCQDLLFPFAVLFIPSPCKTISKVLLAVLLSIFSEIVATLGAYLQLQCNLPTVK